MDNTMGFASKRSLDFKELLESKSDVNIHMMDERLTTKEAENILIKQDYNRKKRKGIIDGVAAILILEAYLKKR